MYTVIEFNLNGEDISIPVDDRECLLDTLRNRLGITSIKRGCEVGECGACTVLIDGVPMDTCIYLTIWARNKKILTVEGLKSKSGDLHPVQQAFIDEAAVQCGFCTPGLIMTAVAIAGEKKRYTREELRKKISGHLCRCTGYENILTAIEKAIETNIQNG